MQARHNVQWRLFLAAVACALGGCTSWGKQDLSRKAELLPGDGQPAAPLEAYYVIFQPENGKAEQLERTLSGQLHVQDALSQVGAAKKYRRFTVELWRKLPSGGIHKIPLEYDRGNKRVTPEFDYALMPGDRIVLREDPSTIIDDMLQSALGPLGGKFSRQARQKTPVHEKYKIEG